MYVKRLCFGDRSTLWEFQREEEKSHPAWQVRWETEQGTGRVSCASNYSAHSKKYNDSTNAYQMSGNILVCSGTKTATCRQESCFWSKRNKPQRVKEKDLQRGRTSDPYPWRTPGVKEWEGAQVHPVCPEQGVHPAASLEPTTAPSESWGSRSIFRVNKCREAQARPVMAQPFHRYCWAPAIMLAI